MGRYPGFSSRECAEDYRRLDVRALKRRDCLRSGCSFAWEWSRGGERIGWIWVDAWDDHVTLRYRTRRGEGEWQDRNDTVPLEWMPCRFGGNRAWFRCPACNRRAAILYGAHEMFACRRCLRLAYESQHEAPHYRALYKAQAIHQKLGGTGCTDDPVFKPKGMHWRTFNRHVARMQEAESRAVLPWLSRHLL